MRWEASGERETIRGESSESGWEAVAVIQGEVGWPWVLAVEQWEVIGSWLCLQMELATFATSLVFLPCICIGGRVGRAQIQLFTNWYLYGGEAG